MTLPNASDFRKRPEVYKNRIWIPHEMNFAEPTPSLILRKIQGKDYMLSSEFYCVDDKNPSSDSVSGPYSTLEELASTLHAEGFTSASEIEFPNYNGSPDPSGPGEEEYWIEYVGVSDTERGLLEKALCAARRKKVPSGQLSIVRLEEERK